MRIKLATVLHRGGGEKEGQGEAAGNQDPGYNLHSWLLANEDQAFFVALWWRTERGTAWSSSQPGSSLQPVQLTINQWGSSLLLKYTVVANRKRDRVKQQPTRIQLITWTADWGSSLLLCCTIVAEMKTDWARQQPTRIQLTTCTADY